MATAYPGVPIASSTDASAGSDAKHSFRRCGNSTPERSSSSKGSQIRLCPPKRWSEGGPFLRTSIRFLKPAITQEAIDATDAFARFLAPPASLKLTRTGEQGRDLFVGIGCARCHVPTLKTADHAVKALRNKEVAAYTDLLLHDMGPDLADICLGPATPSEFRTEPLMGGRLSRRFLHDGRAGTIDEAIRLHGGEAAAARDTFIALTDDARKALLEFVKSL